MQIPSGKLKMNEVVFSLGQQAIENNLAREAHQIVVSLQPFHKVSLGHICRKTYCQGSEFPLQEGAKPSRGGGDTYD
jgi:hypothetical protein